MSTSITDVAGIRIGHHTRTDGDYLTGVTVVLPPPGTVAGVDVRGGGPGTHETDALKPGTLVPTVDAVVLTGGSAYGLIAAHGAQRWCEEHGRGVPMGRPGEVVPIVPAAVIFDLGRGGRFTARPAEDWGYRAAAAADRSGDHAEVARGNVGAGTGAQVADGRLKGGVGTASITIDLGAQPITVGALAVVNARGVPQLPGIGRALSRSGEQQSGRQAGGESEDRTTSGVTEFNTTIAVIATDARLDVADATRTAACAHDGFARAIDPVHTLTDGDTVFALATGAIPLPDDVGSRLGVLAAVQAAAATVMQEAILDGVRSAEPVRTAARGYPSYHELIDR
ncbi:P1 family peptidase [Microlunatus elymi]|uniref:P1 family peptidase n=1 Tax=Microlunatus elymi TaxID=2596828 RepID=A0A516Q0B5_9ACTN|nr:P1 family peptidase [Microlunatus elymi]QDP96651.1 P1 family peptidase [Microlunatus elymi]